MEEEVGEEVQKEEKQGGGERWEGSGREVGGKLEDITKGREGKTDITA